MTRYKLKSLSFFSGCFGLDLGLESAGISTALACDIDKDCRSTIKLNRPDIDVLSDIQELNAEEIRAHAQLKPSETPFLITGGPPCQAFSTAGRRRAFTDPRGNVFLHFIDLINELQPTYAVIENVRGILSAALTHRPLSERNDKTHTLLPEQVPGSALDLVINKLEAGGYDVSFNLYNAANFGVPQQRERVVIIASRNGKVPYLKPTHSNDERFGLPRWKTFGEVAKDIPQCQECLQFPEKRLKYYRMLKEGDNWRNLPTEALKKEALGKSYNSGGGKTGFLRRISWSKPAPTLVTSPIMPATDLAHPSEDRPLSVTEYKRIQQFPDNWVLAGTVASKYRQLGNAVPVGLGLAVARAILSHNSGEAEPLPEGFLFSRYQNTDDISWRRTFEDFVRHSSNFQDDLFNEGA